jgi:hypothetical protein
VNSISINGETADMDLAVAKVNFGSNPSANAKQQLNALGMNNDQTKVNFRQQSFTNENRNGANLYIAGYPADSSEGTAT